MRTYEKKCAKLELAHILFTANWINKNEKKHTIGYYRVDDYKQMNYYSTNCN